MAAPWNAHEAAETDPVEGRLPPADEALRAEVGAAVRAGAGRTAVDTAAAAADGGGGGGGGGTVPIEATGEAAMTGAAGAVAGMIDE